MLIRAILVALVSSTLLATASGQTPDSDAQTLRDILVELRAIHADMRVTETTQLLVAELEMQQGVVNRATENTDRARARLNDIHLDQGRVAADLKQAEDALEKAASDDERKAISAEVDRHKSNVTAMKAVERDASSRLQDMEQRLQTAQDKLADIEAEMSAAISRLGPAPKENPR
ncbi:MAG TPA: hypothetical protein VKR52_11640 [Terracidiphilus sp.]|nr:hypothetical protein [Terracidiphilus sp.]